MDDQQGNGKRGLRPIGLILFTFGALTGLLCESAITYPTFNGCANLATSDFRMTTLVDRASHPALREPLKMALDMDASGNVDIYFVERAGFVKRYNSGTRSIVELLSLNLSTTGEDGLTGIALDPGFQTNRWMYLFYTHGVTGGTGENAGEFRLSRFTLSGSSLVSEVNLLRFPGNRGTGTWHTGGALRFDAYGDLWIGVGDNHAEQAGLPNTNDLRGAILRIHPNPDGTISIPAGNLRSVIRSMPDMGAADTAKVRPEIYVMGCRNPYTIAVDPVRRWLAWGDVGPDVSQHGAGTEEYNLVKAPGFMGWPFFAGENQLMAVGSSQQASASAPVNAHVRNNGLRQLPAAIPPILPYRRNAAVTGPIYRYDGASPSRVKLPPHFNRKWIVSDFNRNHFLALTLDEAGARVTAVDTVWSAGTGSLAAYRPLDIQQGPDGALYILNYSGWFSPGTNTSIRRLEYQGSCLPPEPRLETPTSPAGAPEARQVRRLAGIRVGNLVLILAPNGKGVVRLLDGLGRIRGDGLEGGGRGR